MRTAYTGVLYNDNAGGNYGYRQNLKQHPAGHPITV